MSSALAECEAGTYLKEEDIWHIWRRRRRRRRMRMKLGEELSFSGQEETIAICKKRRRTYSQHLFMFRKTHFSSTVCSFAYPFLCLLSVCLFVFFSHLDTVLQCVKRWLRLQELWMKIISIILMDILTIILTFNLNTIFILISNWQTWVELLERIGFESWWGSRWEEGRGWSSCPHSGKG